MTISPEFDGSLRTNLAHVLTRRCDIGAFRRAPDALPALDALAADADADEPLMETDGWQTCLAVGAGLIAR